MYQNHLNICELITNIIFEKPSSFILETSDAIKLVKYRMKKPPNHKQEHVQKMSKKHVFPQITVGTWYRQLKGPMSLRNHWFSCPPGILLSFRMKGAPRTRDVFLVPQGGSGHWTPCMATKKHPVTMPSSHGCPGG